MPSPLLSTQHHTPPLSSHTSLLELLFDHVAMAIAIFDAELRLQRYNAAWVAYRERDVSPPTSHIQPGLSFFDLTPGTGEEMAPIIERVLAGETVQRDGLRLESEGVASYWDVVWMPLVENKQVVGFAEMAADATERKQAEAALRESEANFRSLLENATNFAVYRVAVDAGNPFGGRVVMVSPSIQKITGVSAPYRFESWFETIHPDDLPKAIEANRRAMQEGRSYRQSVRVYHPEKGEWVWLHTASTPVFDAEGKLTHFNGLVLDITEQKRAEEALQLAYETLEQRVEERTGELQTLLDVTSAAITSLDLDKMLQTTLDRLVSLVQASRAGVMLLNPESGELEPRMLRPPQTVSPEDLAEVTAGCQTVLDGGEPIYIAPDEARGFTEPGALLPLRARGQSLGVLAIIGAPGKTFSEQQQALFESIADQLGMAVEHARLYEQAEQAAAAAERSRLARDLHDAVSQTLFSASLIAEVLPLLWENNPEEGRRRLEELRELTRGAMAEMRSLLLELRPLTLAEFSLKELLEQLAEAAIGRSRLTVDLRVEGERPLPVDIKVVFYRIAQEALSNISKHAGATQATMRLAFRSDAVTLSIQDDGRGFDIASTPPQSLGLGIMRERATRIGATVDIESAIGKGTSVTLSWPIAPDSVRP
ncbi:MAG TPA: PAS domain S-box protein [Caldilineae bacterium]|nr:PAS domain S-box protein [Caldilineae bacterium]